MKRLRTLAVGLALAGGLALAAPVAAGAEDTPPPSQAPVAALPVAGHDVRPFCVVVRDTPVEACVGSMYQTVVAAFAALGLPAPF